MPQGQLQSVVISKTIASSAEDAKKIAKDFGATIHKIEETESSWRFRQLEPKEGASFRTFQPEGKKGVSLIYQNAEKDSSFYGSPSVIKFNEGNEFPDKFADIVDILRVGTFYLSSGNKVEITDEHLDSFIKNFNEKIRGIDLAIDYAHENDKKAAGWFSELFRGGTDGKTLQARVKWTPEGKKVLSDKEFRYLSAEFHLNYQDNESLKRFGPTILGAGLTNRPVIKGMQPAVQLSEGNQMTLEEYDKKLKELAEAVKKLQDGFDKKENDCEDENMDIVEMQKKLSEAEAKLAEAQKTIDGFKADKEKADAEKKLAEKKTSFDKMLSEGKAVEAQREAFLQGNLEKFAELAQSPKTVRLSESDTGKSDAEKTKGNTPAEKIHSLAEKLIADKKATQLGEAYSLIMHNPEHAVLCEEYEKSFQK